MGFGFFEALAGFFFDIDFELAKELVDAAEVLEEWITIGPRYPMDAGAEIGDFSQVVGPKVIDGSQPYQPFLFARARLDSGQDRLPLLLDRLPLAFDDRLIFMKKQTKTQVLPFDRTLNIVGALADSRILGPVAHQQIVFRGDKKAGAAGVSLPSCPAAELVVDAAGLMLVGADYVESAQLTQDLSAKGQYLGAGPLHPVTTATSVRVRGDKRVVTDGPFAETREQLGGYYLVEAKDLDEAIGIAERIPPARFGTIEIRPVMEIQGLPVSEARP